MPVLPASVLVTGASTGIGRAMALHFAEKGTRVFAGVRDLSAAPEHALITPVRLDVTNSDEVREAAQLVGAQLGSGVAGLVNNAGIAVGGPLESMSLDDLRRQLEVNLVGQLAVTQAFLPLLRRHRAGRRAAARPRGRAEYLVGTEARVVARAARLPAPVLDLLLDKQLKG